MVEAKKNFFDNWTESSRHVLYYSDEEAKRLQHGYIAPEHFVLGLIRRGVMNELFPADPTSPILEEARQLVKQHSVAVPLSEYGLTDEGKHTIYEASQEAKRDNSAFVAPIHIVRGVLAEGYNTGTRVLLEMYGISIMLACLRGEGAIISTITRINPSLEQLEVTSARLKAANKDLEKYIAAQKRVTRIFSMKG